MVLRLSQNRMYQTAAIALLPVAVYNFYAWSVDPQWEQSYLKSLVGGVTCTVVAIVLLVVSLTRPDRMITCCGND